MCLLIMFILVANRVYRYFLSLVFLVNVKARESVDYNHIMPTSFVMSLFQILYQFNNV